MHAPDASPAPAERADPRLDRRDALIRHWGALPPGLHSAQAELDEVAWDPETRKLAIVYVADLNGRHVRGCDLVELDAIGRVVSGAACVGSMVDEPVARMPPHVRDWIFSEVAGGRL